MERIPFDRYTLQAMKHHRQLTAWGIACLLFLASGFARGQYMDIPWSSVFPVSVSDVVNTGDTLSLQWNAPSSDRLSHRMRDRVALFVDHTDLAHYDDMDVKVTLAITATKNPDYSHFVPGASFDSLMTVVLDIGYRNGSVTPTGLSQTLSGKDLSELIFNNAWKIRAVVSSMQRNIGSGYTAITELPGCLYLEFNINWSQLPVLDVANGPANLAATVKSCHDINGDGTATDDAQTKEADIHWDPVPGALEYHVEWTWVDDYGPGGSGAPPLPKTTLQYDMDRDATRVMTVANHFRVPLVYDRGWVVFRVRAVGCDQTDPPLPIYGAWEGCPVAGSVEGAGATYRIQTGGHQRDKNWQFTATYAEEGKHKEVMTYADGSTRSRQSIARNNTLNVPIVGESFYDAVGRAAVTALPVPVIKDRGCETFGDAQPWAPIDFYPDFNRADVDGNAHDITYADLSAGGDGCVGAALPFHPADGAELYYGAEQMSVSTPLFDASSYVPKASGFPYTQTGFLRDARGLVQRQSGLGPLFRVNGDHAQRNFYGKPEQIILDRLFASQAPIAAQCGKTVSIDANGQASVAYLDGAGRTMATSLVGAAAKADLIDLPSMNTGQELVTDLFCGQPSSNCDLNIANDLDASLTFTDVIVVPASNTPYYLDYKVVFPEFDDGCLDGVCFHCVYDLEVKVVDVECGNTVYKKTGIIGRFDQANGLVIVDTDPSAYCHADSIRWLMGPDGSYPLPDQFTNLNAGSYTITKTLRVRPQAVEQYAQLYAGGQYIQDTCFSSLQELTDSLKAAIDTMDCYISCEECAASLGSLDDFVAGHGTVEQYKLLLEECLAPCTEKSWCEIAYGNMLTDMKPNGQYGKYKRQGTQIIVQDWLSVYRTYSGLTTRMRSIGIYTPVTDIHQFHLGRELWKQPVYINADGALEVGYLNTEGVRDTLWLYSLGGGVFEPMVDNDSARQDMEGRWYAFPEHLTDLNEFLLRFQPGWERSLVRFHPEFCYYESCAKYDDELYAAGSVPLTSDDFDARLRAMTREGALEYPQSGLPSEHYPIYAAGVEPEDRVTITLPTSYFPDPYIVNSAAFTAADGDDGGAELANKFLHYYQTTDNGVAVDYSLPEFAAMMARCNGIFVGGTIDPSCRNFGHLPASEDVLDKEWEIFKTLYLAEKYRIQKRNADTLLTSTSCSSGHHGINPCIGVANEESQNEWSYNPWAGYSSCEYCTGWWAGSEDFYGGRAPRVVEPVPNPHSDDPWDAAYQVFQSTGQCPLATAWLGVFSELATTGELETTSPVNLYGRSSFASVLLAQSDFQPVSPQAGTTAAWSTVVNGDGDLTCTLDYSLSSIPDCEILLYPEIVGFEWDSLIQVIQILDPGDGNKFDLRVSYMENGVPIVTTIHGGMCEGTSLWVCNFPPQCSANPVGQGVQDLLNMLVQIGQCNAAHPLVQLNTTNLPTSPVTSIQANLPPAVLAALPPGPSNGWIWGSYTPPTLSWTVSDGSTLPLGFVMLDNHTGTNPSHSPWRLEFRFLSADASNFTFPASLGNVSRWGNLRSEGENLFSVDVWNLAEIPWTTLHFEGMRVLIANGTEQYPYPLGTCNSPAPTACAGFDFQYASELAAIIAERIITTADVIETGNIDLFSSLNMSEDMASALGPILIPDFSPIDPTTLLPNALHVQSHVTGSGPYTITFGSNTPETPNCISIFLDWDGAELPDSAGAFSFSGTPDGSGNYSSLQFELFADGEPLDAQVTVSSTCIPFVPCTACPGTLNAGAVYSPVAMEPLPSCDDLYAQWVALVDTFNLSDYSDGYHVHIVDGNISSEEFVARGYCTCIPQYFEYFYRHHEEPTADWPFPDPIGLVPYLQLEDFLHQHGIDCEVFSDSTSVCDSLYSEYVDAILDYNALVASVAVDGPYVEEIPVDGAFTSDSLCFCVSGYLAALHAAIDDQFISLEEQESLFGTYGIADWCHQPVPCPADTFPLIPVINNPDTIDPCVLDLYNNAVTTAQTMYNQRLASMTEEFEQSYKSQCLNTLERLSMRFKQTEHHYTLYYYDQAGDLVRTVPPEGVVPQPIGIYPITPAQQTIMSAINADRLSGQRTVFPDHRLASDYSFNSLGSPVTSLMPDQDAMDLWSTQLVTGLPSDLRVSSVQFTGGGSGYLCGSRKMSATYQRGYVFRTSDAGASWDRCTGLPGNHLLNGVFPTSTIGYSVGSDGGVLKTADGGSTWDLLTGTGVSMLTGLADVAFKDANTGWIVGRTPNTDPSLRKYVAKTTTGGTAFTAASISASMGPLNAVTYWLNAGADNLLAVGYTPDEKNGALLTSLNGGTTWSALTPGTVGATVADLTCSAPVGSRGAFSAGAYGVLLYSPNVSKVNATTGTPWRTIATHTTDDFKAVWFFDELSGLAIFDSLPGTPVQGVLRYTLDGGEHWLPAGNATDNLNALYCYDRTTTQAKLVAVGNSGQIMRVIMNAGEAPGEPIRLDPVGTAHLYCAWAEPSTDGSQLLFFAGTSDGWVINTRNLSANTIVWDPKFNGFATLTGNRLGSVRQMVVHPYDTDQHNVLLLSGRQDIAGNMGAGRLRMAKYMRSTGLWTVSSGTIPAETTTFEQYGGISKRGNNGHAVAHKNTDGKLNVIDLNIAAVPAAPAVFSTAIDLSTGLAANTPVTSVSISGSDQLAVTLAGGYGALHYVHLKNVSPIPNLLDTTAARRTSILPLPLFDVVEGSDNVACGAQGTFFRKVSTTWTAFPTRFVQDLRGVARVGTSTTWVAVGDNGQAIKGDISVPANFTAITVPGAVGLNDVVVHGTDPAHFGLTLAGDDGHMFYTTDLSSSPLQDMPWSAGDVNGVVDRGSGTVFAFGQASLLHRTFGISRTPVSDLFTSQLIDLSFLNGAEGYVGGVNSVVRHTTDGGASWTPVPIGGTVFDIRGLACFAPGQAYAVGLDVVSGVETSGYYKRLAGNAVDPADVLTFTNQPLYDVKVTPSGTAVICGFQRTPTPVNQGLYRIKPNGGTWQSTVVTGTANTKFLSVAAFTPYLGKEDIAFPSTAGKIYMRKHALGTTTLTNPSTITLPITTQDVTAIWWHDLKKGLAIIRGTSGVSSVMYALTNTTADHSAAWVSNQVTGWPDGLAGQSSGPLYVPTVLAFSDRNHGFLGGLYDPNGTSGLARRITDETGLYSNRMWYDPLGRVVLSQNSYQFGLTPKRYSYTRYDRLGRPYEAGEIGDQNSAFQSIFGEEVGGAFMPSVVDTTDLRTFLDNPANPKREVLRTFYDHPIPSNTFPIQQDHLRLRVASTTFQEVYNSNPLVFDHATHYSYDIHGNVKQLVQDEPLMATDAQASAQRWKKLDYTYDLVSGNVKEAAYQRGQLDQLTHRYSYDADNRIIEVETSPNDMDWTRQARYFYYPHGPLQRTELGQQPVQGIDYAYTLQGWLRAVNSDLLQPGHDMGHDALAGNLNALTGRDAMGFSLHYHTGDYEAIDASAWATGVRPMAVPGGNYQAATHDLFNGNIAAWTQSLQPFTGWTNTTTDERGQVLGMAYRYDQLNRLKRANGFKDPGTDNDWTTAATTSAKYYQSDYAYDANGNITRANRYDQSGSRYDSLYYYYHDISGGRMQNRLYQLKDLAPDTAVVSGDGVEDLPYQNVNIINQGNAGSSGNGVNSRNPTTPSTTPNNFLYDQLGRLKRDAKEEIDSIQWTVASKVRQVVRTGGSSRKRLIFGYGADGQRITKSVMSSATVVSTRDHYVYDAQGNIMAIYRYNPHDGSFKLLERPLYGSGRVGTDAQERELMAQAQLDQSALGTAVPPATPAELRYELKDHLGNVAATVSGEVYQVDGNNDQIAEFLQPHLLSASGYEPFGSLLPGRNYSASSYRYGLNGQEKDDEIYNSTGTSYTAEFWQYDPRTGRRWNMDPVPNPSLSSYHAFALNPIFNVDPKGDRADGYVDENGTYLGDDGDTKSHETRVITADKWKSVVGEDGQVSEAERGQLQQTIATDEKGVTTGNSKLLSQYEKGINISEDTWDKLKEQGGSELEPWLVNNSGRTVYYKPEGLIGGVNQNPYVSNSGAYPVGAGLSLYSRVDGVATRKYNDSVFKVPTGADITITGDGGGDMDYYGLGWLSRGSGDVGWVGKAWLQVQQAGGDNSWNQLFQRAATIGEKAYDDD